MITSQMKYGIRRVLIEMGLQEALWYIYKRYRFLPESTIIYHNKNIKTTKIYCKDEYLNNDCLVVYHEKIDKIPTDL